MNLQGPFKNDLFYSFHKYVLLSISANEYHVLSQPEKLKCVAILQYWTTFNWLVKTVHFTETLVPFTETGMTLERKHEGDPHMKGDL